MKRFIVTMLAIVAAVGVSAQDLRFGLAGGLNFAWERAKASGVSVSSDSYLGFQVGAKAEKRMTTLIVGMLERM